VWIDPKVAQVRLMARNKLTAEEADKRINSQMKNEERKKYATVLIDNSGTKLELQAKI
jgi:dephospho-CoA kinase